MQTLKNRLGILAAVTFLFVFFFNLAVPFYSGDVINHKVWGESLLKDGSLGFYERVFKDIAYPNYPPVAMWSFALSFFIYESLNNLVYLLNLAIGIFPSDLVHFLERDNTLIAFLKIPALVANFFIATTLYLIYPYIKKNVTLKQRIIWSAVFLFNPAVIYLSVVWGQIDLLPIAFLLFATYLLFKRNLLISSICLAAAFLSKQTAVIFIPLYMYWVYKEFGAKGFGKSSLVLVGTFYLAYLPFHLPSLIWPVELFINNFSLVSHSVGENALNLWGGLFKFQRHSDSEFFSGLTLQAWGYLLFLISISPSIFLLLKKGHSKKILFLEFFAILSLNYFFFLTRMHERYLIPAIVFLTIASAVSKKYIPALIVISIVEFINLYRGLMQPDIKVANALISENLNLNILVVSYFLTICYCHYLYYKNA
jgi:dolichyl-phosphate-mannose-protein mannosyltransferase